MQLEAQPRRERGVLRGRSRIAKYEGQRLRIRKRGLCHNIAPSPPTCCHNLCSLTLTSLIGIFLDRQSSCFLAVFCYIYGIQSNMYHLVAGPTVRISLSLAIVPHSYTPFPSDRPPIRGCHPWTVIPVIPFLCI